MGQALSIKLRCASWQQLATIYKRDLSKGTMFLRAATPPPVGTTVRIDLTLPSASVIVLTGVVQQHVTDPQRGAGVELKLAPIPTGSIWLIESALSSEQRTPQPPAAPTGGARTVSATPATGVATVGDGQAMADAEDELIRALLSEAESLKKLNPFLVLGVGYEASDADVRAAFGELTKRYHPDRFARYESSQLRSVAAEIFILIRDAYRKLCDTAGRTSVLASLGRTPAPRPIPAPRAATPPAGVPIAPIASRPSGAASVPRVVVDHRSGPVPVVRLPDPPSTPEVVPAAETERKPITTAAPAGAGDGDMAAIEALIEQSRLDEALAACKLLAKKHPNDRTIRAGVELCEGLRALAARDRLEAAQRFESALEIDPANERAARELAEMRRQATNERKGLLSRLMGKKEP